MIEDYETDEERLMEKIRLDTIEECAQAVEAKPGGIKWACYIRALKEKS